MTRWAKPEYFYDTHGLNPDEGGDVEMGDDDALEQESREYYEVLSVMLAEGYKDAVETL